MTQNSSESADTYSKKEVKAAEQVEQMALSKSQNQYLTSRVVALRAQLNRALAELAELREEHKYCSEPDREETKESPAE